MDSRKRKKTGTIEENLNDWKRGRVMRSERWEMEKILDYRTVDEEALKRAISADQANSAQSPKRMVYVIVKWFGYGEEDCTIEAVTSVPNLMAKRYFADQRLELVFNEDQTEVRLIPLKESTPEEHDEDDDDETIDSRSDTETEGDSRSSEIHRPLRRSVRFDLSFSS